MVNTKADASNTDLIIAYKDCSDFCHVEISEAYGIKPFNGGRQDQLPEMHRQVDQNQASVRQAGLEGQQDPEMPIPRWTFNWAKDRTRAKPNSPSKPKAWKRHQSINPKEFASQSKAAPVGRHHVPLWHDHRT